MDESSPLQQRQAAIVRTSIVGIAANVLLAAFKAAVGLASNSIAVVLDAVNNLSDAASSIITIIGAKLAGRKPDRDHPLGHGRYEYLSALVIAVIVLYAGITSLVESAKKIVSPEVPDYSTTALVVIAAAVVVKIVLGRYVGARGRALNSQSLSASGKDALFDAVLSTGVLAAALVFTFTGVSLEAYVGVVIAVVIVKAGFDMVRETIDDILGHRPAEELSRGIKKTLCADDDVLGAYDLLIEDFGPDLAIAQVHVEVRDTMDAVAIDAMTRRLQEAVLREHQVVLATVGVYAFNTADEAAALRSSVTRIVMAHDDVLQMHGFYLDEAARRATFDLIIGFDAPDRDALFARIVDEVNAAHPDYRFAIVLDRDLSD